MGLACTDGIVIDGRTIEHGDCAGPRSARNVLLNPLLDAAVFEAARGGILREGLGFDKCDVAIVTNIGDADHLGQQFIDSPKEMFKVKRTPVDVVLPTGTAVLNATDPLVVEMKELSAGRVTFFALDPMHPVIREHRDNGKRTVVVKNARIVLCDGEQETPLVTLEDLPCTARGSESTFGNRHQSLGRRRRLEGAGIRRLPYDGYPGRACNRFKETCKTIRPDSTCWNRPRRRSSS